MWDILFVFITLGCFIGGVFYARACERIGMRANGGRKHA
jgi:hypothetical protein